MISKDFNAAQTVSELNVNNKPAEVQIKKKKKTLVTKINQAHNTVNQL